MERSRIFNVSVFVGSSFAIALLLIIAWLTKWPFLVILGLGLIFGFVLTLSYAFVFVEDKGVWKGFLMLLLPIPFLAISLFLGARGSWNYALLLILVVTLVKFKFLLPAIRRMVGKQ